jgi:hypothetical protein
LWHILWKSQIKTDKVKFLLNEITSSAGDTITCCAIC